MSFADIGATKYAAAFDPTGWLTLVANLPQNRPGVRLHALSGLDKLTGQGSPPFAIAKELLFGEPKAVRAIYFDKSVANNWPLGWHQDRTIAVRERAECSGYGPWSVKGGIAHVEPPFALIERMVTLRLHLDSVEEDNAPLRIAPGSHRLGKLREDEYAGALANCGETVCIADAGDIWAYATAILHASEAAKRPTRRRVVQLDYACDDFPPPLVWAGV